MLLQPAGLVDPVPQNNSATDTDVLVPSANLELLAHTAAPEPVDLGGVLTYAITVRNNGPSAATEVVLTDVLPAGWLPFQVLGPVQSRSPVVPLHLAPNPLLFLGSQDRHVYALDAAQGGTLPAPRWAYDTGHVVQAAPAGPSRTSAPTTTTCWSGLATRPRTTRSCSWTRATGGSARST